MMTDSKFNQRLVERLNDTLPIKVEQVEFLMEHIQTSKEAAYRRLRGDVPFTFSEACTIADTLSISLDEIMEENQSEKFHFDLFAMSSDIFDDRFYQPHAYEKLFDIIYNESVINFSAICNTLPLIFYFSCESLMRFKLFKWRYMTEKKITQLKYSHIILTESLLEKRKQIEDKLDTLPEHTFIFSRNIFTSLMTEIKYFHDLRLISDIELIELKKDLKIILQRLELRAILGRNQNGTSMWYYLSNINFEATYCYTQGTDYEQSSVLGIYSTDILVSKKPLVCKMHKEWISSLKKYSTLISASGELARKIFFTEQLELLEEL